MQRHNEQKVRNFLKRRKLSNGFREKTESLTNSFFDIFQIEQDHSKFPPTVLEQDTLTQQQ